MQDSLDLKALSKVLMKKIWLIALLTTIGFLVSLLVSKFLLAPQYTSSMLMYVNNSVESENTQNININDINAAQKLVNTYIVIMKSHQVLEKVSESLDGVTVGELETALSLNSVNNTEIIRITATTNDPELSADICNTISVIAPSEIRRIVKASDVEIVDTATVPTTPSSPNVLLISILGALVCLGFSIILILILHYFDTTIKDRDDIKAYYNIPILGEIPEYNQSQRENKDAD